MVPSVAWHTCSRFAVGIATTLHKNAAGGQNVLPLDRLALQADKQNPYIMHLPNCIELNLGRK